MKILYIHPMDSGNAGDKVILAGCENLLTEALGPHESIYCSIEKGEAEAKEYLNQFENVDFDLLVVSGTPWIWDMCDKSKKYQVLEGMVGLAELKKVRIIALGIGSCFPLATDTLHNHFTGNHKEETRNALRELFSKFHLIITRDRIAQICMDTIEIDSFLYPCPACFCDYPSSQGGMPALVFYNPAKGLSAEAFDDYFLSAFLDIQIRFIERFHPPVFAMNMADHRWLIQNKFRARLIRDPAQLIDALKNVNFLLSGRVHAAIPARMMGIISVILPVDTRYLTATLIGAIPWFPYGEGEIDFEVNGPMPGKKDLSKERQEIVTRIKEAMA